MATIPVATINAGTTTVGAMTNGFRVLWRALRHINLRGYLYIWANLAAVVCMLPLVTAPAAWAGLVCLSYQAHTQRSTGLDAYWQGFRENLGRGALLFAANVLILGVNFSNLASYPAVDALTLGLRVLWLAAIVLWLMIQLYLWPIFYHMQTPTLWGALRNAVLMLWLNPAFSLVIALGVTLVVVLSSVLVAAWLLLTFSTLAVIATGAALDRLNVSVIIDAQTDEA